MPGRSPPNQSSFPPMNVISDLKQKEVKFQNKHILPFYPLSDLDEVSDEITIDKFEEYAYYRVKRMRYLVTEIIFIVYIHVDKNEISLDTKKEEDPKIRNYATVTGENRVAPCC